MSKQSSIPLTLLPRSMCLLPEIPQLEIPTYHPPPQSICVAAKLDAARLIHGIFLSQVDKVGGEDKTQKANVQGGDQLLGTNNTTAMLIYPVVQSSMGMVREVPW